MHRIFEIIRIMAWPTSIWHGWSIRHHGVFESKIREISNREGGLNYPSQASAEDVLDLQNNEIRKVDHNGENYAKDSRKEAFEGPLGTSVSSCEDDENHEGLKRHEDAFRADQDRQDGVGVAIHHHKAHEG